MILEQFGLNSTQYLSTQGQVYWQELITFLLAVPGRSTDKKIIFIYQIYN